MCWSRAQPKSLRQGMTGFFTMYKVTNFCRSIGMANWTNRTPTPSAAYLKYKNWNSPPPGAYWSKMWERRSKKRSLYSRGSSCRRTCPRCTKNQIEFTVIDTAIALMEKWQRVPAPHFKYLQQGISLTGLGSLTFANAMDATHEIYKQFDRQFEEGILDHWACSSANDMYLVLQGPVLGTA